ncbi:hypothetical protein D5E85_07775 [Vibrio parahaemolyticus]|nr:hypothetical protein D5E85_07775 [Vibrio parahaemolyticus]
MIGTFFDITARKEMERSCYSDVATYSCQQRYSECQIQPLHKRQFGGYEIKSSQPDVR